MSLLDELEKAIAEKNLIIKILNNKISDLRTENNSLFNELSNLRKEKKRKEKKRE